jgi:hypothetical protein
MNSAIFEYEYDIMKNNKKELHQELISNVFHPSKIAKYLYNGYDLDDL